MTHLTVRRPILMLLMLAALLISACATQTPRPDATEPELDTPSESSTAATELSELPPALAGGEPQLLRGEFTYFADAALFVECDSGIRFPVAMRDDYITAERAYLGARPAPAEPVLMQLVSRLDMLPDMEETRLQPTLVIEQFMTLWPGQRCE